MSFSDQLARIPSQWEGDVKENVLNHERMIRRLERQIDELEKFVHVSITHKDEDSNVVSQLVERLSRYE